MRLTINLQLSKSTDILTPLIMKATTTSSSICICLIALYII